MIIAGTGHRPDKLGGYDAFTAKKTLDLAEKLLRFHQPSTVISGMAQGWDMALAQAAINLGIPFHAYLPFLGQELVWPQTTRLYYHALLRHAQHTVICSEGGFTKKAMQVRNERMVDACDLLLALWNGSPGGTANCLTYAMLKQKPILHCWPMFEIDDKPGEHPSLSPGEDWLAK